MKTEIIDQIVNAAREQSTDDNSFDLDKFHRIFAEMIVWQCLSYCWPTKNGSEISDTIRNKFGMIGDKQ